MSDTSSDDDDSLFKSRFYFDLKGALDEARADFSGTDNKAKAASSAKLAGKVLANTGVFAAKLGVDLAKHIPSVLARKGEERLRSDNSLDDGQREKLTKSVAAAHQLHERAQKMADGFHELQKPRKPEDAAHAPRRDGEEE